MPDCGVMAEMDQQRTGIRFRTTNWTMIVRARSSPADLEQLLKTYWSPVYAYLKRKVRDRHDAEDLTQEFLYEVLLNRDLIGQADKSRGKFRTFLRTALDRFVIDEYRRQHGRHGQREATFVPDDSDLLERIQPHDSEDPARAFDRQWAATVLSIALDRVMESCEQKGMKSHWSAFDARVMCPILHGTERASSESLATAVGVRGPEEISSMLHTVKRKLRSAVREVVADSLDDPADLESELANLNKFLTV